MAMKCSKCGFANNPDGANYCGDCGTALDQDWIVYDSSKYTKYSRHGIWGIMALLGALGCLAYVVINWFYPNLMGEYVLQFSSSWWNKIGDILLTISVLSGSIFLFRISYEILWNRKKIHNYK